MSHLDEGQLTALLDHELTAAERSVAEAHLMTCEECRRLLDEVKALATEADGLVTAIELPPSRPLAPLAATPVAASPRRRTAWTPRWRTVAWAASVLVAVGLGWVASDLRIATRQSALGEGRLDSGAAAPAKEAALPLPEQAAATSPEAQDRIAPAENRAARRADAATAEQPTVSAPAPAAAPVPRPAAEASALTAAELDRRKTGDLAAGKSAAAPPVQAAPSAQAPEGVVTGALVSGPGKFRQVEMEEAVRTLAGSMRLVDGLQPERVLVGPAGVVQGADPSLPIVRVVYEDPPGREMWLDQQRPANAEPMRLRDSRFAMLVGDTVVTHGSAGSTSIRWIDEHGFRLALTGFLAADSLNAMIRRVH